MVFIVGDEGIRKTISMSALSNGENHCNQNQEYKVLSLTKKNLNTHITHKT